jgi:calcineurin-like phosphoesterase family protein
MDDELISRWNAVVADDDTVWVLGDVALGRIDHTLSLVGRLRGRKLLVAGNHDRCWAGHGRRAEGWTERYLRAGFDEVHQGEVSVEVGAMTALACHFPFRGDSQEEDRYLEYRPADRGGWLLHGHVHERWRQSGRMINVGVDVWDYGPVSEEVLGALML